ncbi:hypothetical protein BDV93DRAFT_556627 [Ceratobasidium sp. AG-I]|nr:hypothetical protein BDV93DRAFT_556627 [Ceratobasidium sp. AG-I]
MLPIPEPTPPPSQRTASISANSALASIASRSALGSGPKSGSMSKPGPALPGLAGPANIDILASLTSWSNHSDDNEIVAVDVEDHDEPRAEGRDYNREREEDGEILEGEGLYDDDMCALSRGGIMLRPDSRMTNTIIVRSSFTEGRAASQASHAMSAFGGL